MKSNTYSLIYDFYNEKCDEDARLLSRRHMPEYIITMDYIHKYLKLLPPNTKILELGAATGRYSLALAEEGYDVTAVDLLDSHIEQLTKKINPKLKINAYVGNAEHLDDLRILNSDKKISLNDNEFDMVLILGPLYHTVNQQGRENVLREATRVCKKEGYIISAFCMLDASLFRGFHNGRIMEFLNDKLFDPENFDFLENDKEPFYLCRPQEVEKLISSAGLETILMVATDSIANIFNSDFDNLSDEEFELYIKYLRSICERPDMLGLSMHIINISKIFDIEEIVL